MPGRQGFACRPSAAPGRWTTARAQGQAPSRSASSTRLPVSLRRPAATTAAVQQTLCRTRAASCPTGGGTRVHDRKNVEKGKSVYVRVGIGGRRINKKKKTKQQIH